MGGVTPAYCPALPTMSIRQNHKLAQSLLFVNIGLTYEARAMYPTTEAKYLKERKRQLRKDLTTVSDPFDLLTEVLSDNERLREKLNKCHCQSIL